MAELPELPAAVRKPPKAVLIVGAVAAGVIAFMWWRNRNAVDAATVTTDPLTGLGTGAEANVGATGSNAGVGAEGLSQGTTGDATIHDQASWTADVIDKLGGTYEPAALYDALGAYLAGLPVNADQAAMVRAAWAASGKWPFIPASYTLSTTGSTPGGGGPGVVTPAAPTASAVTSSSVTLSIPALPGATSYEWRVNGADHAHTSTPSYRYPAKAGTTYRFSVRAVVNGHDTANSAETSVTTDKGK